MYQTTEDLPKDIIDINDIAVYWGELGKLECTASKSFGQLSHIVKCLLCILHGDADSEEMFSQINLITTDHRNQLQTSTVSAFLDVKMN